METKHSLQNERQEVWHQAVATSQDIFVSKMGASYDFTVSMIDIVTVLRTVTMETKGLACIWSNSPDLLLNMREGWGLEFLPSIPRDQGTLAGVLSWIRGALSRLYRWGNVGRKYQFPISAQTNSSLTIPEGVEMLSIASAVLFPHLIWAFLLLFHP